MKKIVLSLSCILFCIISVFGQGKGINNNWLTGYGSWVGGSFGNCRLNFFSGSLSILSDSITMGFFATHTTMADTNGNILFYTNGYDVDDSSNQIMLNGDSISPSYYRATQPYWTGLPIPQANLAIPVPGSNNLYYLFHNTFDDSLYNRTSLYLYYSMIDMNGNLGKGEVIAKNVVLISDSLSPGKITACKHANGRDWWVTCLRANSNLIYELLVTPYGISGPFVQNIGSIKKRGLGQSKFSPDGNKFAYCIADYTSTGNAEVMDFDRCTGIFSNPYHITLPQSTGFGGGCEFSPNSNLLYISNVDSVYQYNLTASNIDSSKIIIAEWDSFYSPSPPFATLFYTCQYAPDGKIYVSTGNSTLHLHVINNPDVVGLACNIVQHGIALPFFYTNSLANHPNYFLGRLIGSPCDTVWSGIAAPPPKETGIKVFSNPNNGRFTLWFIVHDKPGLVEVYDVNGNVVFKEGVAQWSQYKQVDITTKTEGVYFVKMIWGAEEMSCKVIKGE